MSDPFEANCLAPKKKSRHINKTFTAKAGMITDEASMNLTVTKSKTLGLSDFMDLNGDRYPDILCHKQIQYTNSQGGMSKDTIKFESIKTNVGEGKSKGNAYGIKGTFYKGTKSNSGTTGKLNNINGSFGVGDNNGNSEVSFIYADINGDGLPDRIDTENDSVQLNIGYNFLPSIPWLIDTISNSRTQATSLNVGNIPIQNLFEYSFSLGIGGSFNFSTEHHTIADINNDELFDILFLDENGSLFAHINTGTYFYLDTVEIGFNNHLGLSSTLNISTNAAASYGMILPSFNKMVYSGYLDYAFSLSNQKRSLRDFNGDGYLDYGYTDGNELKVRYGKPKKTNLLKKVTTPGKSSYDIDYKITYPNCDDPYSKWVMYELETYDGFSGDGVDSTAYKFEYFGSKYHRLEREYMGFDSIVTKQYKSFSSGEVYRKAIEKYHVDDYIYKGLKKYQLSTSHNNKKYIETFYIWGKLDISTGALIAEPDICANDYYPAITQEDVCYYDFYSEPQIRTKKEYIYGPYGNILKYKNWNDVETSEDNLITDIEYSNNITKNILGKVTLTNSYNYPSNILQHSKYTYNDCGSLKKILEYNGTDYAITDIFYEQYGNVSKVLYPKNVNNNRSKYIYSYDTLIHTYPISITDYWGHTSLHEYNYKLGLPTKITAASGAEIHYTYYCDGKIDTIRGPKEVVDNNPFTIKCEYWDVLDNSHPYLWAKTRHCNPTSTGTGTNNEIITVNFSDGFGRTVQTKKTDFVLGENKIVVSGKVTYDEYGRLDSVFQPIVESYDLSDIIYVSNGDFERPTITNYDIMDRIKKVIFPDETVVYYKYYFGQDAFGEKRFVKKYIDQNDIYTLTYTDTRGLQTTIKTSMETVTSFLYSPLGQLLKSFDPENNETVYDYDKLGRLIYKKHPDANTTKYTYDNAGNILTITTAKLDALGETVKYLYSNNRLTEIQYPSNPVLNVHYEYDTTGVGYNCGRLIKQQDASGVQTFDYGCMGELIKNIHAFIVPAGLGYTFQTEWTYDTWNRVASIKYPDGEEVYYKYDNGGKLWSLDGVKSGQSFIYIDSIYYNKYGDRERIDYGNKTFNTYNYDINNLRLKTLESVDNYNKKMQHLYYKYDNVGNIIDIYNESDYVGNDLGGSYSHHYEYDNLYRLADFEALYYPCNLGQRKYHTHLEYSSSGNIKKKIHYAETLINGYQGVEDYSKEYTYYDRPHTPTKIGTTDYKWDLNGNMIYIGAPKKLKMCWNMADRLSGVHDFGDITQLSLYLYDASHERVWKFAGKETQMQLNGNYVYNSILLDKTLYPSPYMTLTESNYSKHYYIEGERICTKMGGGFEVAPFKPITDTLSFINMSLTEFKYTSYDLLKKYIECLEYPNSWDIKPNLYSAEIIENEPENLLYYYHPNHIGSPTFVTNYEGKAVQHLQMMPFGEISVNQRDNGSFDSRYKFTAKELDNQTGFTYFGERYYDSEPSIWLSVDPMAEKRSWVSPYVYCQNNPVGKIDPTGSLDINRVDWSQNNKTGEIVYHKDLGKNDANMLGKDYSYLGKDNMFGKSPVDVYNSVMGADISGTKSFSFGFDAETSKDFMNEQGYEFKVFVEKVHTTTIKKALSERFGPIYSVDYKEEPVQILKQAYFPKDNIYSNYKVIDHYKKGILEKNWLAVPPYLRKETFEVRQYNYSNSKVSRSPGILWDIGMEILRNVHNF